MQAIFELYLWGKLCSRLFVQPQGIAHENMRLDDLRLSAVLDRGNVTPEGDAAVSASLEGLGTRLQVTQWKDDCMHVPGAGFVCKADGPGFLMSGSGGTPADSSKESS